MQQDAFWKHKGHMPEGDEDRLMHNSATGLSSWYLLQGWSRDTDLESERAWRRDRPLFMGTPSTEQGQILYCYSLLISSQIKASSCSQAQCIEKFPSKTDGFPRLPTFSLYSFWERPAFCHCALVFTSLQCRVFLCFPIWALSEMPPALAAGQTDGAGF